MDSSMIHEFFDAVQAGNTARLEELMENYPHLANTANSDGLTPLGYAAHFGQREAVRALLDHNADVNAVSRSTISYIPSNTALHAAIAGARNLEVIRLLLARHAKTDLLDSNGHTCLHTAAFHEDNREIIELLIEHGADVNARTKDGDSPLSLAIKQGNHLVAELLREHGALL